MSTRLRRWLSRRRCLLPGTLLEQELLLEVEGLLLHLWALELWIASAAQSSELWSASAAQSSEVCAQRHGGVPDWSGVATRGRVEAKGRLRAAWLRDAITAPPAHPKDRLLPPRTPA